MKSILILHLQSADMRVRSIFGWVFHNCDYCCCRCFLLHSDIVVHRLLAAGLELCDLPPSIQDRERMRLVSEGIIAMISS